MASPDKVGTVRDLQVIMLEQALRGAQLPETRAKILDMIDEQCEAAFDSVCLPQASSHERHVAACVHGFWRDLHGVVSLEGGELVDGSDVFSR